MRASRDSTSSESGRAPAERTNEALQDQAAVGPRVLLVAPQPFFTTAGTPINVLAMARALLASGHAVEIASFPGGEDVDLPGLVHHRTWRLPGLGRVPIGFSVAKLVHDVLLCGLVLRLLLAGLLRPSGGRRIRVVHAIEEAAFFAVPLARLFGAQAVIDLDSDLPGLLADHVSAPVRALAGPARMLRRFALRRASCAITVAPSLSALARAAAPGLDVHEIRDIPLAESLVAPTAAERATLRAELDLGAAPVVAYTGNFDRRQGVELLLEAFARVHARHPDLRLLLVGGEPSEVARLSEQARLFGIADAVRLPGRRPATAMPACMGVATMLVSPRLEPLVTPLKIYSYMASGCPIVATDLPTHSDVLDATTATLVPPTVEGLAGGMTAVLADPAAAARRADRAKALVAARHSREVFEAQLHAAYAGLTGVAARSGAR